MRFIDPQKNVWWVFELAEFDENDWTFDEENHDEVEDTIWRTDETADANMTYVHNSLVEGLKKI